jgi:hypothetical protein
VALNDNEAKQFAAKYQLSAREMAVLFGVSISLASSWLSPSGNAIITNPTIIAIENQDRIFEILKQADGLRACLTPGQLQIYEDWRDRTD